MLSMCRFHLMSKLKLYFGSVPLKLYGIMGHSKRIIGN